MKGYYYYLKRQVTFWQFVASFEAMFIVYILAIFLLGE